MPVFLAYVRHHDAFEIGTIMLVTGVAQLVTAPIAGAMESRFDPRYLSAAGFALFALGLGCSALQSRVADFDEMFWPQVLRGVAIMFCLLPPTRLALGALTAAQVPDASGLFNLMRNLGGAIGIALIDTILYGRTAGHAEALRDRLIAGDITAARAIGLDLELFTHRPPDVSDATVEAYLRPMVEKAAFALSTNEAWALLAAVALLGLLLVPFAGKPPAEAEPRSSRDIRGALVAACGFPGPGGSGAIQGKTPFSVFNQPGSLAKVTSVRQFCGGPAFPENAKFTEVRTS